MKRKVSLILTILMFLLLGQIVFGGTLPLNTGYDYSNFNIYPIPATATTPGPKDEYWIRIASFPTVTPPVGESWVVNQGTWMTPMTGPTNIPSTWINGFRDTWDSFSGVSAQNPGYVIYRKCFCLPQGYQEARIRGTVRSDESIQIWLNSISNILLPVSPFNANGTPPPYPINYSNQAGFRVGRNCVYVLVEDTGSKTGFNLAANLMANNVTPIIAKGVNMSFAPCSCGSIGQTGMLQKREDLDEQKILQEIVKSAEAKRIETIRKPPPKL